MYYLTAKALRLKKKMCVLVGFSCSCVCFVAWQREQSLVFDDIDFSEHVRLEVRGMRKLGENPVLASLDFEVMSKTFRVPGF